MDTGATTGAVVFVYGTLTDPDRVAAVVDAFDRRGEATLVGLHRVDGTYPTLAPGGETTGRLLWVGDIAALDAYEGVDRGLYTRVTVPRAGDGTVDVYVGDPAALDAPATWPGDGAFADRVEQFVSSNRVVVTTDDARRSPV